MKKRRRTWFLRQWRDYRELSQEQLGEKIGLTQGMISQLESGLSDYTGTHLENLSTALGCTVYQLLFQDPRVPDDPMALYEALPEYERAHAIEMLKGLQRAAGKRP
jgi:transcriptional regulator with XRE-family HTH domain